uniref:Uncharacterized protein n=1 Tax=Buteo japonicus TaxID=224669 RepID=A0A8C0HMR8_9AVES
ERNLYELKGIHKSPSFCLHDSIYPQKKKRKNFCVDTTKKLFSNQAASVSELQVSCQNDLVHRENKKDMTGKATLVETSVIKGQLSFMVLSY